MTCFFPLRPSSAAACYEGWNPASLREAGIGILFSREDAKAGMAALVPGLHAHDKAGIERLGNFGKCFKGSFFKSAALKA